MRVGPCRLMCAPSTDRVSPSRPSRSGGQPDQPSQTPTPPDRRGSGAAGQPGRRATHLAGTSRAPARTGSRRAAPSVWCQRHRGERCICTCAAPCLPVNGGSRLALSRLGRRVGKPLHEGGQGDRCQRLRLRPACGDLAGNPTAHHAVLGSQPCSFTPQTHARLDNQSTLPS